MPVYRDEKLKTWYVKFRYRDWQGKARYTTKRGFKTKRDALKYEFEFKTTSTERIDIKLAVLAEKYLADKKLRTKISNFKIIKYTLQKHFLESLGHLKISELSASVMKEWQNDLIVKNLKYNTLIRIHTTVNSFLNYAIKYYGLKENPLKIVGGIGHVNKEARRINFWEYEEFEKFISNVKNFKHKICFKILFFGGLRVGELLALDKRDFNFKENKISITKSKIQSTGEISTPKTIDSVREIDMPSEIMLEVKRYIRTLKIIPSPLFDTNHSSLLVSLKRCAGKAGIKIINVHDLRHSHVSHLIHLGAPITLISRRLGHKSPKITLDVYSHMYSESGKKITELLSKEINKKNKP